MGLRVRKSIKIAKGVRLNLNKDSVSFTLGGKGAHYTVNSKGKQTATISIPKTGISYSQSINSSNGSLNSVEQKKPLKTGILMTVITIFLGLFGVHRFASGQIGMGVLYLCTGGVFFIGWIHDIIYQIKHLVTK